MSANESTLSPQLALEALTHAPQGLLVSDSDGIILWCNQTFASWLKSSPATITGTTMATLLSESLSVPSEQTPDILTINNEDKSPSRWLQRHTLRVSDAGVTHNAVFFTDVSEQFLLREKLDQLETIEPVSRLLNRRAMLQNLEPLISRSRRYNNPLSVIAMELVNWEEIGAKYSDAAANHAVLELSHLLKDQLRWADIISRTDDTHIVIILPETALQDAGHLAEKINGQVAELQIQFENAPTFNLQACYGVAAWEKGNDALLLLRNANQAMGQARSRGQGQIEIA